MPVSKLGRKAHSYKAMASMSCKNHFSLIELLVVISILAVLASLLSPTLKSYRKKANALHCMNNLKQIGLAVDNYCHDHDDRYPSNLKLGSNQVSWDDHLSGYDDRRALSSAEKNLGHNHDQSLPESEIYVCPEDDSPRIDWKIKNVRSYAPNFIANDEDPYLDKTSILSKRGRGIVTEQNGYSMRTGDISQPSLAIGWTDYIKKHNIMGIVKAQSGAVNPHRLLNFTDHKEIYFDSLHGIFQQNYLMLDLHVASLFFEDTLTVVRTGRDRGIENKIEGIGSDKNGEYDAHVIGTAWDCWW